MDISKRIAFIASQTDGRTAADIGCDHAYIACLAVLNGKAEKAYACDVAQGPLSHAVQTIESCGLQDKVIPVLSNGLENVPEDADQIIIAGMGGQLIADILSAYPEKTAAAKSLLLSPHKDPETVRQWLAANGWTIEKEFVIEDGSFYPLIRAVKGCMKLEDWNCFYGIHVVQNEDAWNFLQDQKKRWTAIYDKTPEGKREKAGKRLEWIAQAEVAFEQGENGLNRPLV